jgi:hypothetical protein
MNVDDSYEIAVRRLSRLGHAGVDLARNDRLHDLEELATLACDENDRLTRELDSARNDNARLQRLVATLQETLMSAQSDDAFAAPKPRARGAALFFFAILIVGAAAAALFVLRPWERPLAAPAAAVAVTAPAPAPAPAPAIAPIAPVVAAPAPIVVPKVEPIVPKIVRASSPKKIKSHHRHAAKHHKHVAAS